jgi:hypothetical protein
MVPNVYRWQRTTSDTTSATLLVTSESAACENSFTPSCTTALRVPKLDHMASYANVHVSCRVDDAAYYIIQTRTSQANRAFNRDMFPVRRHAPLHTPAIDGRVRATTASDMTRRHTYLWNRLVGTTSLRPSAYNVGLQRAGSGKGTKTPFILTRLTTTHDQPVHLSRRQLTTGAPRSPGLEPAVPRGSDSNILKAVALPRTTRSLQTCCTCDSRCVVGHSWVVAVGSWCLHARIFSLRVVSAVCASVVRLPN